MKASIIYTLLGIQAAVFSAFIWVIDGRAESRSDIQRAENTIKISAVNSNFNDIKKRLDLMEGKIDDTQILWTLEDVRDLIIPYFQDQKTFIKNQDAKIISSQKKKYEVFYLEDHEGQLYKIYAIETSENDWLTLKMIKVKSQKD